ncbi:hypothetical protein TgHK011_001498 [Trichoderma gracile]|nr:hypothetical protein TgHK011_001498 [Trichoderma gracile]
MEREYQLLTGQRRSSQLVNGIARFTAQRALLCVDLPKSLFASPSSHSQSVTHLFLSRYAPRKETAE